jgi:hypothetical protein
VVGFVSSGNSGDGNANAKADRVYGKACCDKDTGVYGKARCDKDTGEIG